MRCIFGYNCPVVPFELTQVCNTHDKCNLGIGWLHKFEAFSDQLYSLQSVVNFLFDSFYQPKINFYDFLKNGTTPPNMITFSILVNRLIYFQYLLRYRKCIKQNQEYFMHATVYVLYERILKFSNINCSCYCTYMFFIGTHIVVVVGTYICTYISETVFCVY